MSQFVLGAFKTVAYSIIFIIVFSVLFYLYRAYALNQRMENIMTSMEQEVMQNNGLSAESYHMFDTMIGNIMADMNNGGRFVRGYTLNYGSDSVYNPTTTGINYVRNLANNGAYPAGDYGDIAIIELTVNINAIQIFDGPMDDDSEVAGTNIMIGEDDATGFATSFTYVSQVPCLKYISVTD